METTDLFASMSSHVYWSFWYVLPLCPPNHPIQTKNRDNININKYMVKVFLMDVLCGIWTEHSNQGSASSKEEWFISSPASHAFLITKRKERSRTPTVFEMFSSLNGFFLLHWWAVHTDLSVLSCAADCCSLSHLLSPCVVILPDHVTSTFVNSEVLICHLCHKRLQFVTSALHVKCCWQKMRCENGKQFPDHFVCPPLPPTLPLFPCQPVGLNVIAQLKSVDVICLVSWTQKWKILG